MTDVKVRRADLADLAAVTPLFSAYREFYEQARDDEAAQAFLNERLKRKESVIFIAHNEARTVGFMQLYPTFSSVALRREWILNDLFVDPAARGQGAGAALLEAARRFAQEDGARRLVLETQPGNPARRLYERSGWVEDSNVHYYRDNEP